MVNEVIVNYLKQYSGKFSEADLKEKILSRGYSEADYFEAKGLLNKPAPVENKPSVENFESIENRVPIKTNEKAKKGGGRWMMVAAIIGSLFFILSLIGFTTSLFSDMTNNSSISSFQEVQQPITIDPLWINISIALFLVGGILGLLYYFGFFKLGEHTKSRLLKATSLSNMILLFLFIILAIVFYFLITNQMNQLANGPDLTNLFEGGNPLEDSFNLQKTAAIVFGILFLLMLLLKYLMGVCLIIIRKDVKLSLVSGILELVLAVTISGWIIYLISLIMNPFAIFALMFDPGKLKMIGFSALGTSLFSLVVLLFETLTLFSASRKFE